MMTHIKRPLRQQSCFHQNWYRNDDMRRGVQVSFEERNPTRDTGTVQRVCGFDINTKISPDWKKTNIFLTKCIHFASLIAFQ